MSDPKDLLDLTAEIVSAFVANNDIPAGEVPTLIANTHGALTKLSSPPEAPLVAPLVPAVSIKRSVTPDAIICLEDGLPFKAMKRHLSKLGMTPDSYRAKWGLAHDYPMVAPNYAEQRSVLAKSIGLGRKATLARTKTPPTALKAKRGRPKASA